MLRILFICHGNICRSTMAEFIFKNMVSQAGLGISGASDGVYENGGDDFYIDSAATSREEIGNPVDRRTVVKLKEHGIACGRHFARQITRREYDEYDLIIIMDTENEWGLKRIIPSDPEGKVHMMLEYAEDSEYKKRDGSAHDVSDPWYTHDFETTYKDLTAGCAGLLKSLIS
ncbi:MAG: low molecular weight phosphotyrosine protein phosphatase [Lachnospiraceae bacterium]|nr:low molecular weight phosphotyrosine protein phosphatase [Lachnospiraceae bacterium]